MRIWDNIQPCVFDRLIDDQPRRQEEGSAERVISLYRYRKSVERDLTWLFNSQSHAPNHELYQFEDVPSSVVNYGFRSFCGLSHDAVNHHDLEAYVVGIIRAFEPRILAESLVVRVSMDHWHKETLHFEIHGELWAQPVPERLWLKTALDLNTGRWGFESQEA